MNRTKGTFDDTDFKLTLSVYNTPCKRDRLATIPISAAKHGLQGPGEVTGTWTFHLCLRVTGVMRCLTA